MEVKLSNILTPVLPYGVVRDQWETLRIGESKSRIDHRSIVAIYFLPLVFGVCAGIWGTALVDNAPALFVTVAVYTGAFFSLLLGVFDKSLLIRSAPFQEGDEATLDLADQLFTNICYTVVVGLVTAAILAGVLMLPVPAGAAWVSRITVGVVAGLLAHLFVMSGMVMKRFRSLREALKP